MADKNREVGLLLEELAKRFPKETTTVFAVVAGLVEGGQMPPQILIDALTQVLSMHEQSMRDPLTHLYNRRMFEEILGIEVRETIRGQKSEEIIKQAPLALALMDVDGLKKYNDTFGHPAGDEMLSNLAQIFLTHFREADVVARIGGDEFAAIMPRTRATESLASVQRVMEAVNDSPLLGRKGISISVGLSDFYFPMMNSWQDLYRITDKFLYKAKSAGRNQVWYPMRDAAEG